MSSNSKLIFNLSEEDVAFIDAKIATGDFASTSEVIAEGIRALQARDETLEAWLRNDVVPTYTAMKADPSRGLNADAVFGEIRTIHAERLKDRP